MARGLVEAEGLSGWFTGIASPLLEMLGVAEEVGGRAEVVHDVAAGSSGEPQARFVCRRDRAVVDTNCDSRVARRADGVDGGVEAERGGDADGVERAPRVPGPLRRDDCVPGSSAGEAVDADYSSAVVDFERTARLE